MSLFWPFHSSCVDTYTNLSAHCQYHQSREGGGGCFPDQGRMHTHNTWRGIPSCTPGVCARLSFQTRQIVKWRDWDWDVEADADARTQTQTRTWRRNLTAMPIQNALTECNTLHTDEPPSVNPLLPHYCQEHIIITRAAIFDRYICVWLGFWIWPWPSF